MPPAQRGAMLVQIGVWCHPRWIRETAGAGSSPSGPGCSHSPFRMLAAHTAGQVQVAIGRASDYFGPGALNSALGETVFATALTGARAQVMGNPDQPHSYSYNPDVAKGLVTLGTAAGATGETWHLPLAEALTTRQIIEHVYRAGGHTPRTLAAGRTTPRALGLVQPAMRE